MAHVSMWLNLFLLEWWRLCCLHMSSIWLVDPVSMSVQWKNLSINRTYLFSYWGHRWLLVQLGQQCSCTKLQSRDCKLPQWCNLWCRTQKFAKCRLLHNPWIWMLVALEQITFLLILSCDSFGIVWSSWFHSCCKWGGSRSSHCSLSCHDFCRNIL